ncbi:hypothetical protein NDU88_001102 [Pleurodeles waltl]|uniref:Uncharacterized protein n=1 Tax=Pleurodeles waltl TaxID=8319 RepID=A0AAV7S736_PLEWA|nr:hypothetical protein NDU88_001102 [Pleurodeles waltl]
MSGRSSPVSCQVTRCLVIHAQNFKEQTVAGAPDATEDMGDDTEDYVVHTVFAMGTNQPAQVPLPKYRIMVGNQHLMATINTGPSIELMSSGVYHSLNDAPLLTKAKIRVFTRTQPISLLVFQAPIAHQEASIKTSIYVARKGQGTLISGQTAEALGLISFALRVQKEELCTLLEEFADIFKGIKCLRGKKVKLYSDQSIQRSP